MRGIRSYTYTNSDCYADANSYSYRYAHAYTYTNANPMLGAVYTDAATSPHPGTAPVTSLYEKETHCSIRLV